MARTRPVWAERLAAGEHRGYQRPNAGLAESVAAIILELGEAPWAGVPCWSGRAQRWAVFTVPVAYAARYDTHVRPAMPGNPVSLQAVRAVAAARASYADHATGRNSRPSNERLAEDTGYSVRTVQRADTALRLLGVATEVLRGRQRSRAERFASWRVGDRGRGWASVWALHDNPWLTRVMHRLSPHPEGSSFTQKNSRRKVVATGSRRRAGTGEHGAARRASPDAGGLALAARWRADAHAPPWSHRHSPAAWAAILAAPAQHHWSPRDLNALIADWAGVTGRRVPDAPHKPIGLLGTMLAWHGAENLDARPAVLEEAREAAECAAARARRADQLAERAEHERARAAGRAALAGRAHAQARAVVEAIARRAAAHRAERSAVEAAGRAEAVRCARGH